jgi:release factor glutamine methyltransferase
MYLKEWVKTNRHIFTESDLGFMLKEIFSLGNLLLYERNISLDKEKLSCLDKIKRMYLKGLPMAYILGNEEFFGLKLKVNPQVLVPRKETELIVEKALDVIKENSCGFILDLGCGSANIAIAIKKAIGKDIRVFSSDVSLGALTVAKKNCLLHETNILLVNSNLFGGFKFKSFDLIISNPPYVAEGEIRGPLEYEPRIALAAGRDGLAFIKAILSQAHLYLRNNGYLIMEIGYSHKEALSRLLAKTDRYETIEWIKDYDGNCRGILLKNYKSQIPNSKQTPIAELQ